MPTTKSKSRKKSAPKRQTKKRVVKRRRHSSYGSKVSSRKHHNESMMNVQYSGGYQPGRSLRELFSSTSGKRRSKKSIQLYAFSLLVCHLPALYRQRWKMKKLARDAAVQMTSLSVISYSPQRLMQNVSFYFANLRAKPVVSLRSSTASFDWLSQRTILLYLYGTSSILHRGAEEISSSLHLSRHLDGRKVL